MARRTSHALGQLGAAIAVLCTGCTDASETDRPTFGGRGRVASTRGAAIVLTHDERVAVAANRTSGVITVFHLDAARSPSIVEKIDVGVEAEPWAAVIGADDDSAYVLLRGEQRVVRVLGLHSEQPELDPQDWPTGAEPTAIAITPSGARVYVANWGEGTLSTFRTDEERPDEATDLNLVIAESGVLGSLTESSRAPGTAIWTDDDFFELGAVRPGLAHPRALAITDDGDTDDTDETLYATEFFSQPLLDSTETDPDLSRQGFVYAIDVGTGRPVVDPDTDEPLGPISLSALSTGFDDAEGNPTSCFPNQLFAAAVERDRLYVTSLCASPRGPVEPAPGEPPERVANFMTLVHPAIFVVDTAGNRELPEAAAVLTRMMMDQHGDASDLRMPLIPNDIALLPSEDETRAYVTAFGADAVFAVDYGSDGLPRSIGVESGPFIDLQQPGGRLPVGIALGHDAADPFALTLSDYTDVLSVIDLGEAEVTTKLNHVAIDGRVDQGVRDGRRLFATGLDKWSHQGRAFSSCESCHPEGLSDGVVWRFARGPRRTLSTAGTYYGDEAAPTRRVLLWTANVDEMHDVEAIARGVSGGAGGVSWVPYQTTPNVDCRLLYGGETPRPGGGAEDCPQQLPTSRRQNGLNGSLAAITRQEGEEACKADAGVCEHNALDDWGMIDAFVRSVRAPQAPTTLVDSYRESGEALFATLKCATCHGGAGWTVSHMFYTPSYETNGELPYAPPPADVTPDIDRMRGSLRTDWYAAPAAFASLNQPLAKALQVATESEADGAPPEFALATFRSWAPADSTEAARLDYVYGKTKGAVDRINCVLRSVGTFPDQQAGPDFDAIVAPDAPNVAESRRVLDPPLPDPAAMYVDKLALGEEGFNVPTLTGLALGAPYFHAGNARTLEELFDSTFALHHAHPVIAPDAELTRENVRDLVSYLLSIDDTTSPFPVPPVEVAGHRVNPDLCAQFVP